MSDQQSVSTRSSDVSWSQRLLSSGGLAFVYISAAAFLTIGLLLYFNRFRDNPDVLSAYYPELILFIVAVFTALLGVSLLRAAGVAEIAPGPVINTSEWETIKGKVLEGDEQAISQYVRLRSLTGFTGVFTKLGLQGLPLATIGLTIFFALMYLRDPQYLELAKLTLGAFIGSFVQKQVGERQGNTGVVQLPSGERLKIQGPGTGATTA